MTDDAHTKIQLVSSEDDQPMVKAVPGKCFEVVTATVVDSDLQAVSDETADVSARPARLCGSRSTCVAIVEID
ncbi:hypothetical protein IPZ58_36175 [Streptomyces roseoverticillatus]|uniref:hypothetical protein n=1 Tax=Streptomyces roseoverticillatus TaxID=66429 RepID=UPI001F438DF1|nr:hypothetical protein [Streptomyces roseoverticillatus]MCF3106958.1 hypothetical protein [Streptomyces roseoverticillatus]